MSPPADGSFPDREADELARRIDQAAQEAYQRFLGLIDAGVSPRDAIARVRATFDAEYYTELSAAFSRVLDEPWTLRAMRDYPVSGVTLSRRLYEHWRQTSAEVTGIVRTHAQGMHQARELALKLYEGYGFRSDEPLKVAVGNFRTLPAPLRSLATEPAVRTTLMHTARRAAATQLRTRALQSAYVQAFDAALRGAARPRIERLLRVAVEEKSRYFANRIAQAELARGHSGRIARDLMADATIDVVQWRLSGAHPVEDICDLFARVDRFGLGPGVYPKHLAPKPIAHPFCRCRLRSRPDLRAADAREDSGAERAFLGGMGETAGARLMGSKLRLRRVMQGRPARDVWNDGMDPAYRVQTLPEFVHGVVPKGSSRPPSPPGPPTVPPAGTTYPPKPEFVSQRTTAAAGRWAVQSNLVDFADYTGVHVSVANQWNQSLFEHLGEFPELRRNQRYTGTIQGQFKRYVQIERDRYVQKLVLLGYDRARAEAIANARIRNRKAAGTTYAHSWTQPDVSGIAVNAKWGKNPDRFRAALAADVDNRWHPVGCDTVRSVVDHELGHQLDALLGLSTDPEVQQLYRQTISNIGNEVSRYAGKNIAEFIAEAWAESKSNPAPRPVAVRLAEIVRARYRARHPAAGP